jgi:ferredoxin
LRQRFAHKLLYFPERYGALACTGCGRCIRACPVNIDIREVILDLQSLYQRTISVAASVPPLAKNT